MKRAPLTARQREALARRLEASRGKLDGPAFPRLPRDKPVPASFAQERLWFMVQLERTADVYNESIVLRLRGEVHRAALASAVNALVERHEVLRTTFEAIDGTPYQIIHAPTEVVLELIEANGPTAASRVQAAREHVGRATQEPFDLKTGPLLRATLIRLDACDHVLVLATHHIAVDGESLGILYRELVELYGAFASGRPSPLAPLSVDYADFAGWQRGWLEGSRIAAQLAFWKTTLAGAPPALLLPTDLPRPPTKRYRGSAIRLEIPATTSDQIRSFARDHGATPFIVLLAVYRSVLARWAHQDDVVVGTPVAHRNHPELAPLVGMFVNMLAIRTTSRDATFRELVAHVKEASLAAYSHQDVPFERVVEMIQPPRDMSRTPIFQAMMSLLAMSDTVTSVAGLSVAHEPDEAHIAQSDLWLTMFEVRGRFAGHLEYDVELFARATARRFVHHFLQMLDAALARPDDAMSSLPLGGDADNEAVTAHWRGVRPAAEPALPLALFDAQAARTPDAVALHFEGEEITYRELSLASEGVAALLRERNVGPGARVAIVLEPSTALVIATLGSLRSGAICVPVDAELPKAHLERVVAACAPAVVLTDRAARRRLADVSAPLVELDAFEGSSPPAASALDPNSAAFAFYPYAAASAVRASAVREVVLSHRAFASSVHASAALELAPSDIVALGSSPRHCAFFRALFSALTRGSSAVLLREGADRDATRLLDEAVRTRATVVQAPQWMLDVWTTAPSDRVAGLRMIDCTDGPLDPRTVTSFVSAHPVELVSFFGPTESAGCATIYIHSRDGQGRPGPSLGRPSSGTRVYVVEDGDGLAPIGVPGELVVGGECLANRIASSAAFGDDRFADDDSTVVRTGNLVRWLPDTSLEYIRRSDAEIEIGGVRIILDEVERQLMQDARIEDVSLTQTVRPSGGPPIVLAYFVSRAPLLELQRHLTDTLPEVSTDARIVDRIPRLASGRADEAALASLAKMRSSAEYVAPRNDTERMLVTIFQELLQVEQVGVHDDFFSLGGHSFLATRLVARIGKDVGVDLGVRLVFEAPTVATLALKIAHVASGAGGPVLGALPRPPNVPLSFHQAMYWHWERRHPGTYTWTGLFGIELHGDLDLGALSAAASAVFRRHETLRTSFRMANETPVQVVGAPRAAVLERVSLGENEREALGAWLTERATTPLDLGRPARAFLVPLAAREYALVLVLPRMIIDPLLGDEVVAEIVRTYTDSLNGVAAPEPPKLQYADYAVWQHAILEMPSTRERIARYRQTLRGAPPLALPYDRPPPPVRGQEQLFAPVPLDQKTWARIENLATDGSTIFVVLSTLFRNFLAGVTGQTDIVVMSPHSLARSASAQLAPVMGSFLNHFILRGDVSGKPSLRELVRREHEVVTAASKNADLPVALLCDDSSPWDSPFGRCVINYIDDATRPPPASSSIPGLTLHELEHPRVPPLRRTDLTWMVTGTGKVSRLIAAADVFEPDSVVSLAKRFSAELERALLDADALSVQESRPI